METQVTNIFLSIKKQQKEALGWWTTWIPEQGIEFLISGYLISRASFCNFCNFFLQLPTAS